jgi:hypothetical protein
MHLPMNAAVSGRAIRQLRLSPRTFTLAPQLQIINHRDCFSPIDGI